MNFKASFLILTSLCIFSIQGYTKDKANKLTKKEQKENWQLLFDGKSTEKWKGEKSAAFPQKGWEIRDECLVSNKGGNILSKEEFGNFDFKWEWKMITKDGNSGIKYFVKEYTGTKLGTALGIEYQMFDDGKMDPTSYHANGAVYELYSPVADKKSKPVGEWNESRVLSVGNHVEHWLNGKKVAEYERGSDDFKARIAKSKFKNVDGFGLPSQGMLMLTDHGSVVYFRNMKIRKL